MIRNNIKIGWRNLLRNKSFSLINIAGLSLSIAVFILIMEYVSFEWGTNRFHKNLKQLYRASVFDEKNSGDYHLAPGFAPIMKSDFPAIADIVRIGEGVGNGTVTVPVAKGSSDQVQSFTENNISFVDGDFFKIFSFPVLYGSPSLNEPQTLALSANSAKKYFGNANAVGKILSVSNQFGTTSYTVVAVFKDMPGQSDIQADILLSFKTLQNPAFRNQNDWADPNGINSGYTAIYFLLNPGANSAQLANQATQLIHKLLPKSKDNFFAFQPMANLHLAPVFNYSFQTFGSLVLVVSFLGIAILILVIAWVNYINLSTVQAISRAKDVGVRKVLGASKWQVVKLQLTETGLLVVFSVAFAILLVGIIQPVYNNFTGKILSIALLNQGWILAACLLVLLITTLGSGGYVAMVLSSFEPLKTIRSKGSITIGGVSLRKSLVVFQFTISIVFIIATITLYRQLHYMQTQDLGFRPGQLVAIDGPSINQSKKTASLAFENELGHLSFVKKYAASNDIPGKGYNFSTQGITRVNPIPGDEKSSYSMLIVDDRYFDTYGIKIKQGATFTPAMLELGWQQSKKVMLNEAAVKKLGFKSEEQVVGKTIKWGSDYEVVGVVKDYHHLSLHTLIEPMVFLPAITNGYFTVKIEEANVKNKLSRIRDLYKRDFPGEPFNYSFIDEVFDKQYTTEQKMGELFISSAGIAIFIASLGLFGLAVFAARQKVKEIGIRKVLGASVINIVSLISKDFISLVVLSVIIASPIAWFVMNKWLQQFAYRLNLQWWVFLAAGGTAVLVALITISFQAVKAAVANPVKSLRSE
jgi:putative ABC transport system permease protein